LDADLQFLGRKIWDAHQAGDSLVQVDNLDRLAVVSHTRNFNNARNTGVITALRVRAIDCIVSVPDVSVPFGVADGDFKILGAEAEALSGDGEASHAIVEAYSINPLDNGDVIITNSENNGIVVLVIIVSFVPIIIFNATNSSQEDACLVPLSSTNCHSVHLGVLVDKGDSRTLNGYKANFARVLEDDGSRQPGLHIVVVAVVNIAQSPVRVLNLGTNPLVQTIAVGVYAQIWRSFTRWIGLRESNCAQGKNQK